MKLLLLCAALSLLIATMQATAGAADEPAGKPFLSPMFSSHMVLQRNRTIPVWGWAAPGTKVSVTLADKHTTAKTGADGRWMAKLPAMPAGGPYELTVSGPQTVTLGDVLLGDVWVCSGQSNMEMGIGIAKDAEKEIAAADYPQIRLYTVPKSVDVDPRSTASGHWDVCTPKSISYGGWGGFSAAAYYFGRELHRELGVPIGLIHTSWGGTPAEAWTSADALKTMPDYRPAVAKLEQLAAEKHKIQEDLATQMVRWWAKNDPGSAAGLGWADPAFDSSGWKTMALPTLWENAGLPGFDGIVWFLGEIAAPADSAGKEAVLRLGPIDDRDTTWVNGVKVGATDQYDAVRNYTIPAGVLKAGKNVIAVRVLDTGGGGGLCGKPDQMSLDIAGDAPISLAGQWAYHASKSLEKADPVPGRVDDNPNFPAVLYNGMIAPVIPYGITGAIWYQGEANAWKAYQYRTLLPTMIRDWRTHWKQGDFPFYIVQLANWMETKPEPSEDDWAELREAQLMTAQSVPNSGIAVAIDIGDAQDIHPKNKQEVGRRLALAALANTYGKPVEYSGPAYKGMRVEGGSIVLSFDHVAGGLVAGSYADGGVVPADKLKGFAIAGEDHHFVWADAVIAGDTVVASSPQVAHPVAVRYAWESNPVCNLYNKAGLPASPFRTDDWPGKTVNNK